MNRKSGTILTAILCAMYAAVRLWRLDASCLWFDEIFSIHAAEHSWDSILSFVAQDLIHPPLFYLLLKLWIGIGGESLLWVRGFSVFFTVVSIIPLILLLHELKQNNLVQIICLCFLAVNGTLLKYSQEVRMYSLLMCFALFSTWLFSRYYFKGKSFILLVIVNILLVYTHYFGWMVVGSEVAAILIFQRIKWRRIMTMAVVTFASFTPWMYAVWSASKTGTGLAQNIGRTPRPGAVDLTKLVLNLIEPFYSAPTTRDALSLYIISLPLLLIAIVAIAIYFSRRRRFPEQERQVADLLVLFVTLPITLAFVGSWVLPHSVWGTRHLIVIFAPLSILFAIAVTKIASHRLRISILTLSVLFIGYAFVLAYKSAPPQASWCAWEQFAVMAANERPANIYVFEDLVAYHFWFALEHRENPPLVSKIRNIVGTSEDLGYFLPRGFDAVETIDVADASGQSVWIAYRGSVIDEQKQPLKTFIDLGYRVTQRETFVAYGENAFLILLEK